jgi:O-antigen ligase
VILYFLAANAIKNERQQKVLLAVMAVAFLLISTRSYRNFVAGDIFNWSQREVGPFWAVGLNANHFGAFICHYWSAFLGLYFFVKDKWIKRLLLGNVLIGIYPLLFSYSRGAYLGALASLTLIGLLKKRILLIFVAVLLVTWQTVLPPSVTDRITMTETESGELESSAAHRLDLWDRAAQLFKEQPLFGAGFGAFGFNVAEGELTDTHNFYIKLLAEQGVIGFGIFLFLLCKALLSGWRLLRDGSSPFQRGLGLAFLACVLSCAVTNLFGDRWSYFALGGYFWILWGATDRGILISQSEYAAEAAERELAPAL